MLVFLGEEAKKVSIRVVVFFLKRKKSTHCHPKETCYFLPVQNANNAKETYANVIQQQDLQE